jgi:transcriptional regulator with XRE-family HTH domain
MSRPKKQPTATVVDEHPVRQLRRALGELSQESFASRFGTTTSTIHRWERDPTKIPTDELLKLFGFAMDTGKPELIGRFADMLRVRFDQTLAPVGPSGDDIRRRVSLAKIILAAFEKVEQQKRKREKQNERTRPVSPGQMAPCDL